MSNKEEEKPEEESEELLASICYSVYKDSKDVIIDASMGDYNETCTIAIIHILNALSKESHMVETIDMIRKGLVASGEEEILLRILTGVGKNLVQQTVKKDENKPCISPSDML